ncbi:type II secretion system protein [Desulfonatronovibrio magnus]|uniref:type II secretion system protein n=1 Tax=Desulfonatronovibrio magnus TaxID=698827 RepID=UPI0005EAD92B|nr:type II secretion system protein [Desulfonatronovibrio magnus]
MMNKQHNVHTYPKSCKGFTLLEVVAVLIILGIIAAVAVSRYQDTGADDLAAANTLKAHLRYAQLRAMGDIVAWGIEIEANKYTLVRDNGSVPNLPGENSAENNDLDATLSPQDTIMFSAARGRPYLEGSDPENFSNPYDISVGNTQTITITPETGFIQ